MILRANQHTDLSGLSLEQAYFKGDMNTDKQNNFDDFVAFKTYYEAANGTGSFAAMVASVPEPTTLLLTMLTGGIALLGRRRAVRSATTGRTPKNYYNNLRITHVSRRPRGARLV